MIKQKLTITRPITKMISITNSSRIFRCMLLYSSYYTYAHDATTAIGIINKYIADIQTNVKKKFGALWVHCLPLALADFGRDWHRSEHERARGNFVYFLSGKPHTISPTSVLPNFTKFAHNMWICVAMNPFRTTF